MMKCSFCGREIEDGTGKMFVTKSAKVLYFCSRKCEKNLNRLRRKPLATRWTEDYAKEKKGGAR